MTCAIRITQIRPRTMHSWVVRLPDSMPDDAAAQPGQWWPPAMLDPEGVYRYADEFDVFHVHFAFDPLTPAILAAVADALAACGKPLVYAARYRLANLRVHRASRFIFSERSVLRGGVICPTEFPEVGVTLVGAGGVIDHYLLEEGCDVVAPGVFRVPDVLAVVMPSLQRVILHRHQVVCDIVEPGLTCSHDVPPNGC
jgi:hypothetical protein